MTTTEKRHTATARVTMTLEILVGGGGWGPECTVAQVWKQAADGAANDVQRMLQVYRESGMGSGSVIRVVGEPVVTAVLAQQKE